MSLVSDSFESEVTLSVVIPCRDEQKILEKTAKRLSTYLMEVDWAMGEEKSWEIIFVNDGSTDDTLKILGRIAGEADNIFVVSYPRPSGQGMALRRGFSVARGRWVISFDADLDYGPEHIKQFLKIAAQQEADIVIGSPYSPMGRTQGVPFTRLLMSRAMNWYFRAVFSGNIDTFTCILRLYRRSALRRLLLTSFDKDVLVEILIKAELLKMHVVQVPVVMSWNRQTLEARGKGWNLIPTARKAWRHLGMGFVERPFYFLKYPILLLAVTTIWLGIAIAVLFCRHFSQFDTGLIAAITLAFSASFDGSPHTFLFFFGCLQTCLILLFGASVVLQNKWQRDSSFLSFCQILENRERRSVSPQLESGTSCLKIGARRSRDRDEEAEKLDS